jgi:Spherulation-specific family 4
VTLVSRRYVTGLRRKAAGNWRLRCALVVAIAAATVTGAATTATAANKGDGAGVTGVAANRHRGTTTTTVPPTTTSTTSPPPTTTTSTTTTSTPTTTGPPVSAPSDPRAQLVPLYEYAGSSTLATDWAAACASDAVVVAAGANSGPPTNRDADWTLEEGDLLPAMKSCYPHSSVKGETVGYINTGYGSIPVSTVDEEMKQWLSFDPSLAGFFFDEASDSSSAANENYYAAITSAARSDGATEVVWNWGTDSGTTSWPFVPGQSFRTSWPNYVVVFEGAASSLGQWVPAGWESGSWASGQEPVPYSNSLAAIVYDTPSASLSSVCSAIDRLWSVSDNLFGYYVTNQNLPNPYAGLDEYNATEVAEC